jgi:flagellar biosynthesis protein FlhB
VPVRQGTQEATEEPTPRRLDEARRRGEVAVSRDLVSAVATAAAIGALLAAGSTTVGRLVAYWKSSLAAAGGAGTPGVALGAGLRALAHALAAPLGAAFVAALAAGLAQTRGLLALAAIEPRLDRLSPAAGFRRFWAGGGLFQVGKGLVKGAVVGLLGWWVVRPQLAGLAGLAGASPRAVLAALGALAARLGVAVGLAALALGVADLLVVRRGHRRRLRMTRDEVRRERKESEGDPIHRAERRRLQREILEQRMIADVRKADLVVVNPDHIAVALRYDARTDAAPVVVASGERLLAEQIKQVARQSGVPIFREVTLARSLRRVADGEEIPAALYEAVAELLRTIRQEPSEGSLDLPRRLRWAEPSSVNAIQGRPAAPAGGNVPAVAVPSAPGWKRV